MTTIHSSTTTAGSPGDPDFDRDWSMSVVLRREIDGPVIGREPLAEHDLLEARAELWFNGYLRQGRPDQAFDELVVRAAPCRDRDEQGGARWTGVALEASSATTGEVKGQRFPAAAMAPAADRAATRLIEQGVLRDGDAYVYEIEAGPRAAAAAGTDSAAGAPTSIATGPEIKTRTLPPRYTTMALAPLLARARPIGDIRPGDFTVIFTATAHDKVERYARKGATATPAVETGCMLLGGFCACPQGEMFLVVRNAIEVHAEEREFALIYTASTWDRVQRSLRRFQGDSADTPLRMVGQGHGHNFGVDGEPCEHCATARVCSRTTVFVSLHDSRFMRAVFARQPWSLCWIAGTNARRENVASLFTWRRGLLRERGYHIIDEGSVT